MKTAACRSRSKRQKENSSASRVPRLRNPERNPHSKSTIGLPARYEEVPPQPAPLATPAWHPRRDRFESRTREEELIAAAQPVCLALTTVPKSRVRPRVGR